MTRKKHGEHTTRGQRVCNATQTRWQALLYGQRPLWGSRLPLWAGVDYPPLRRIRHLTGRRRLELALLLHSACSLRSRVAAALHRRYIADSAVETASGASPGGCTSQCLCACPVCLDSRTPRPTQAKPAGPS